MHAKRYVCRLVREVYWQLAVFYVFGDEKSLSYAFLSTFHRSLRFYCHINGFLET